ncbi:PilN domain-containing protein [Aquibium sp. ELW1220]|uniref:PilN domain-containing protein n=1 Tax=Aquibium sp. ELW1220 TaxID=2976766 RepID=UPI0025B0E6B5|nr:PilN domain-containing protein [Aquibium sp. ELW1220]MDN2581687.1 PilN domain-containing protein [Aquibium sp. ELW1220]
MLALLLDTCEWLKAEMKSLARDLLHRGGGKGLSRSVPGIEREPSVALTDLVSGGAADGAPVRYSGKPVAIALTPSECLRRPVAAIRLRASHLRAMAEVDISTTPIRRADVVLLFERRTAVSADNAYFVVRRGVHAALRDAIRAHRHGDVEIAFTEDGRSYRLDPHTCRSDGATARLIMRGLAALALLSAGAMAADTVVALAAAKQKLGQEIARFDLERAATLQARQQITQLEQTRQMLDRTVSARRNPAILLDALAAALPDHAWLTDVRISNGIIEIAGVSTEPMELPSLFSASGSFQKASFQGNVVKAIDEDGERFTMHMEVSR